ncbi:MAG: alfa-L-rhamnosidase [Ruminococcaceae bacterium]|nr:alfa-L-rhamnosidase [Oscillospiraceae bacterium]
MFKSSKWITSPVDMGQQVTTFRKKINEKKKIKKATLYATAMGNYAAYIDGQRVYDAVLTPGFTGYDNRVLYQKYDITDLIKNDSTIEVGVGQGWAVGYIGYANTNHRFANFTSLIAEIELVFEDGKKKRIGTNKTWDVYSSVVRMSEIYHGETVDLTHIPEFIGKASLSNVNTRLQAQNGEWIKEHERIEAKEIIRTPKGELVIDFGQNMTGYVEVRVKGKRGDRIVMHHAEVLDSEGNFYTANLRKARNENTYILSGGDDVFKPTYSFQGFRYIRLAEYPFDEVDKNSFTAIAVYSDMKRTGSFHSGNEKINQLYHNIIWGQRSNFLDIPTDCPQRDERLGWTGDAQVFAKTASINYDTEKFFAKWLEDVALEQTSEGAVYGVVPHCFKSGNTRISAAWGDAACVIPWEIYLSYGNKKLLKKNFPMMKKWVEYLHGVGPEEYLWLTGYHYGDWLAMDAGEDSYVGATSCDLIASAYFAYSLSLVIKAGKALGEDISCFEELYKNVRKRFREYFMENGMPKEISPKTEIKPNGKSTDVDQVHKGMTQTAITLILKFGLADDSEKPALTEKLVNLIKENGGKMTTGFVGTPYILHALSENGRADVAYSLLFAEHTPSWLYSVCHGATTMWEHWNSLKEDGSFWSTAMNSFNHYAYGAVYDWIFGVAVGIKPCEDEVAYKNVTIEPHPDKRLGFADASIESRNGKIRVHWYYKGDDVFYEVDIPAGVTAKLTLPSGETKTLTGGSYQFA